MKKYIILMTLALGIFSLLAACSGKGAIGATEDEASGGATVTEGASGVTSGGVSEAAPQVTPLVATEETLGESLGANTPDGDILDGTTLDGTSLDKIPLEEDFPGEESSVSSRQNRAIVKDGDTLYYRADNCLKSLNLTDNTEKILYESPEQGTIIDYFVNENRIYLLDYYYHDDLHTMTSLYLVNTDGSGKKLLKNQIYGMDWQVYIYQRQLYLYSYTQHEVYELATDGALGRQLELQESVYRYLPEDDTEIWLGKLLGAPNSLNCFHCIWAQDSKNSLTRINPEDGSSKVFVLPSGSYLTAITEDYIISGAVTATGLGNTCYLTDIKTGISKQWFQGTAQYIDYDETGGYFSIIYEMEDGSSLYTYIKVLWDGTMQKLFVVQNVPGMYKETSGGVLDFREIDNTIYYHFADRDRMVLMSRDLDSPQKVSELGSSYDNKMFSKLGHVEVDSDKAYSDTKPEKAILNIYCERLVLNSTSKAFQKINKRLRAIQEEDTEAAISFAKANEQSIVEVSTAVYSHTFLFMGLSFLSERYLCIYQYVDEYTGGAHSMPYKKYYIFDLKTGEQLALADIVNNTSKEVHDIILEHFSEAIAEYPGKFDGNACDTVNRTAGLESAFYLTREGLGFYYPPYELACFAAGFQDVIIPYSEFDLRIDVSGAEEVSISSELGLY